MWAVLQLVVMLLIIPLPLFFAQTVFGKRGLEAWVVIGIIWAFVSAFTVILYPLYESRRELAIIIKGMVKVRSSALQMLHISRMLTYDKDVFAPGSGKYAAAGSSTSKA